VVPIDADETTTGLEIAAMPTPKSKSILVVEDDEHISAILRLALEGDGYAVDSAGDGLDALQKVREKTPDLIILDLNMPRMGGEDFLYAWHAGSTTPEAPVLVVTATSQALRPTDLGVEAVLPKPFDLQDLLEHVRGLLTHPPQTNIAARRHDSFTDLRGIVEDLSQVTSVLLVTAEQLVDAPNLPDDVRPLTAKGSDAAHRASVLVRRLTNLVGPPE
jgi:DNA-binding response OmpR family regulator